MIFTQLWLIVIINTVVQPSTMPCMYVHFIAMHCRVHTVREKVQAGKAKQGKAVQARAAPLVIERGGGNVELGK